LDAYIKENDASAEILGIIEEHEFFGIRMSRLVSPKGASMMGGSPPAEGPVQYVGVQLDGDRSITCVQRGLYLISAGPERLAVLLQGPMKERHQTAVNVEVAAPGRETAECFLRALRHGMRLRSVYRGHVLSLNLEGPLQTLQVKFHHLPATDRNNIILPQG